MIVPHNNPNLTSGTGNANSSPWVIAIKDAGIPALGSIVNACILISAWSAGNAYCYVGSRIIVAMAIDKQLPKAFAKTNRWGVPYFAVITSWLFGPLAYLSLGTGGAAQAFSWLLNLVSIHFFLSRFMIALRTHALLVYFSVHRRWSSRLGYSLIRLHPIPQGLQGSRSRPKRVPLQRSFPTLRSLVRNHRIPW